MKGSTFKRCSCPPEYDAKGRRKACNKRHGSWAYVVDVGRDPKTGRRRQLKKSGFRTKDEAEAKMAEVLGDVDAGRYRHDGRQTVKQYLEAWLEMKVNDYRPTTYANTKRWLQRTYPYIGHLRLRDLKASHISKMNRDMVAQAAKDDGKGITTVRRMHNSLSAALSGARKEGLIRHNPAMDAWLPAEQKTRVNPWNGKELGKFLDKASAHPFGTIFELMAMGGLRRGEALGLRWSDVNLEEGYLVVRQQLVAVQLDEDTQKPCKTCGQVHKGLLFGPPKTWNGEGRRVDLGQFAVGVLLEHRLRQDAERAKWGEAYADHDLVFADVDGNPWRPDHVTKTFTKITKAAGVRQIRLHDLRHGRASLMLAAGVDIAIVSKILGHGSIRVTSDTYGHLIAGVGQAAAEAADSLIIRQPRDQSVTNGGGETTKALPDVSGKGL